MMNKPSENAKVIYQGTSEDIYPSNTFVEGVQSILLNPNVTKLNFFDIVENENGKETRRVSLSLAIPTPVLIEFCVNFLSGTASAKEQILKVSQNQLAKMLKQLEIISPENNPDGPTVEQLVEEKNTSSRTKIEK